MTLSRGFSDAFTAHKNPAGTEIPAGHNDTESTDKLC
jgi:hypothetical protein